MGRKVHTDHGRDHRPAKYGATTGAGPDPIKGMLWLPSASETDGQVLTRDSTAPHGIKWADAGGSVFQVAQPLVYYADQFADMRSGVSGTWTLTNDTTAPGAYYSTSTSTTGYLDFRAWIDADQNVSTAVIVGYGRGTDCGIFKIRVAREYSGGVSTYHDNWQATVTQDTYFGSSDWKTSNQLGGDYCVILPRYTDPADGNLSGGGWTTVSSVTYWDGGPGWYRIRIANNGTKNASSSDYRLKIFALKVYQFAPSHATLGD